MNLVAIKSAIDWLSAPTISFTILTVIFPFVFPPSDWFEKIHRKFGLWRIWSKSGGVIGMVLITAFFVIGYFDPYFNKTLTKADNFPIVLMIYSMWFYIWLCMYKAYRNDARI